MNAPGFMAAHRLLMSSPPKKKHVHINELGHFLISGFAWEVFLPVGLLKLINFLRKREAINSNVEFELQLLLFRQFRLFIECSWPC